MTGGVLEQCVEDGDRAQRSRHGHIVAS